MLAPISQCLPCQVKSMSAMAYRMRCDSKRAWSSGQSARIRANSSPPIRAAKSAVRQLAPDDVADLLQQRIAGGVTGAVVDRLEAVEVDVAERMSPSSAPACATAAASAARRRHGWAARSTPSWLAECASSFCKAPALRDVLEHQHGADDLASGDGPGPPGSGCRGVRPCGRPAPHPRRGRMASCAASTRSADR